MMFCPVVQSNRVIQTKSPRCAFLVTFRLESIEALRYGASGYLLKNIPPEQIIHGIKIVHQGSLLIHPDIAKKLPGFIGAPSRIKKTPAQSLADFKLTSTEQMVIQKIANGLSNKEIAQELFLSEGTVKNYITEILSKLNLRDRTQIAIFFLKNHNI
jgi:DNA-binding NarL/FixJ family response regulator